MVFNSLAFIIFFLLVVPAYFICPARYRTWLLLIASCYFYMTLVPQYILVLAALVLVNFLVAKKLELTTEKKRRWYFLIGLSSNLAILFFFKYFNFFNQNIALLAQFLHWHYSLKILRVILPLGLSFHTFQCLSYLIEVYRGKFAAEKKFSVFTLYVMFFPQLVAGPIERPEHLLPQLHQEHNFDRSRFISGLQLMAWGFFKKIVVADRLALIVDFIYSQLTNSPGPAVALAIIFFTFQLYADFSGYCDIAVGAARLFGYDLVKNFNLPFTAVSIADFWRRWHISLSSWLHDYVFLPLAFSVKKNSRTWLYACALITFLASGLWHGAGWTFVVMGAWFGLLIVAELVTKNWRAKFSQAIDSAHWPRLQNLWHMIFTFSLVGVGWVFFRAPNMITAILLLKRLFLNWRPATFWSFSSFELFGVNRSSLILGVGSIIFMLGIEWWNNKYAFNAWLNKRPPIVRSVIYCGLVLTILSLGTFTNKQFIYFQF